MSRKRISCHYGLPVGITKTRHTCCVTRGYVELGSFGFLYVTPIFVLLPENQSKLRVAPANNLVDHNWQDHRDSARLSFHIRFREVITFEFVVKTRGDESRHIRSNYENPPFWWGTRAGIEWLLSGWLR